MDQNKIDIKFIMNGQETSLCIPPDMTALQAIRDVIGLKGTKEGCGIGECGACTIEVDGKAINACLMFAVQLDGREVMTVEGLDKVGHLHPLQEKFLENHAVQCGFCTPGILMSTHALLKENSAPDDDEIKDAVSGNLCRCTGYQQIFSSIKAASCHGEKFSLCDSSGKISENDQNNSSESQLSSALSGINADRNLEGRHHD